MVDIIIRASSSEHDCHPWSAQSIRDLGVDQRHKFSEGMVGVGGGVLKILLNHVEATAAGRYLWHSEVWQKCYGAITKMEREKMGAAAILPPREKSISNLNIRRLLSIHLNHLSVSKRTCETSMS